MQFRTRFREDVKMDSLGYLEAIKQARQDEREWADKRAKQDAASLLFTLKIALSRFEYARQAYESGNIEGMKQEVSGAEIWARGVAQKLEGGSAMLSAEDTRAIQAKWGIKPFVEEWDR
jgi:hypothetical protein